MYAQFHIAVLSDNCCRGLPKLYLLVCLTLWPWSMDSEALDSLHAVFVVSPVASLLFAGEYSDPLLGYSFQCTAHIALAAWEHLKSPSLPVGRPLINSEKRERLGLNLINVNCNFCNNTHMRQISVLKSVYSVPHISCNIAKPKEIPNRGSPHPLDPIMALYSHECPIY